MLESLKRRNGKGLNRGQFTLIELMIVLIILGLLAALITPSFVKKAEKAKRKTAKVQINMLENAVKDYYLDTSEYPDSLQALVENPGVEYWDGPYLDPPKIPEDPWNEPYKYRYPGQHSKFDIYSYGADGTQGGEEENADVTNWDWKKDDST